MQMAKKNMKKKNSLYMLRALLVTSDHTASARSQAKLCSDQTMRWSIDGHHWIGTEVRVIHDVRQQEWLPKCSAHPERVPPLPHSRSLEYTDDENRKPKAPNSWDQNLGPQ